jgi:hypothetical protein
MIKSNFPKVITVFLLSITYLSSCSKDGRTGGANMQEIISPKRTWSDVIKTAKSHGYENFADYSPQKEYALLTIMSDSTLANFFRNSKDRINRKIECNRFVKECAQVKTVSEYYELLEKYPYVFGLFYETEYTPKSEHTNQKSAISGLRTKVDFEKEKKAYLKTSNRVFLYIPKYEMAIPSLIVVSKEDSIPTLDCIELSAK